MIMSILMSIIFPLVNHPLTLGLILLIQTIIISLITGLMNLNFWFSYIVFLIMVGGMLILFIYMTSIASNEKFKFSSKLFMLMMPLTIIMTMFLLMDKFLMNTSMINYELINQTLNTPNFNLTLNKFVNWPLNMNFMLIIIYLLITLIMVVKITNIQYGPLRQKH
uniref:NADH-ubiquinone oxidoreductase chain 6 n=1 Tax=Cerambycidae sp. 6 KM-2017 TaxID=2219291 RepID=A0A346RGT0_9CUCU|nr:NADH dehydrogenase subunit 6 [Cerambycidae sp. 6 KM-2017]